MPTPQARHDNKHLAVLFALSRLLNWALNNPLQAMVALLAMQSVVGASRSSREARDITPDITDITASFDSRGLDLEAKETKLDVLDITEVYRARQLQTEQTCVSSIALPDSGDAWALTLGGINGDVGNEVAIGSDGSIVLTGYTYSFGAGLSDVLLAKFTADGALSWARALGGSHYDKGLSLALKPDGSVVLTGSTTTSFAAGSDDVLLAQFTANGSLSWARTLGGSNSDVGNSLAIKVDGSIVLTGYTDSFGAGYGDVLLAQFTENGSLSWARIFGGIGYDEGRSLALNPDGSIVLTGTTFNFDAGTQDVLLAQLTENGSLSWARNLGGNRTDLGNSLALKPDGGIVLTGYTSSFGAGSYDVLLAQFTASGNVSWARTFGGSSYDQGNSLALKPDGDIVLTGYTLSFGAGNRDVLLAQFTENGTLIWARTLGGTKDDYAYSLALNSDGSIVLTGSTDSFGAGSDDVLLTVLSPTNTIPLLFSANSLQVLQVPLYFQAFPANINSYTINPTVTSISSLLLQNNSIPIAFSPILNAIITPLSFFPIQNAWQQPKNLLLTFKYTYIMPTTFLRYVASQPSLNIDLQGSGWLNYDANLKTISGTPIDSFNKETQITINPDAIGVAGTSAYYGPVVLKLCISSEDSTFIKSLRGESAYIDSNLALNPDGSIVLTGIPFSFDEGKVNVLLAQFAANGTLSWARTFNGSSYDYGNSLALKPDGSIVLTGTTYSFGAGSADVLLAQFTADGSLSWARTLGGSGSDYGNSLALKLDGSIVLTGYADSFGAGDGDVLLAQFTENGSLSWARIFGGIGYDEGRSLALNPDGSIVLTGYTTSFGAGLDDVLLAQVTANGTLSWASTLGGRGSDYGNSLGLKPDGSIVLSGYTSSFGAGSNDVLLAQFTSSGTLTWAKTFGGSNNDQGNTLALKSDGSIVLTGSTTSFGAGLSDVLLAQFTANGALSWARTLGGSSSDVGRSLALKPDGSIVLAGLTGSFSAGIDDDVLIAQLNAIGETGYDHYLIRSISTDQSMDITPIMINIANSINMTALNISAQNWETPQNFTINPSVYALSYFKDHLLSPVYNQPFNQTYSLDISSLLGYGVVLLRLTEWNKATLPAWLRYNPNTMLLSGAPTGKVRGNYYINMNLQCSGQQQEITYIINVLNTAPYYIGNTTLTTLTGRFVFPLAEYFKDDEMDAIYPYAIAQLNGQLAPTIASIDATSGRLFGTALSGDQGTYQFNITALDSFAKLGWQVITLKILNSVPSVQYLFANPDPLTVGRLFRYDFPQNAISDPDGDVVNYAAMTPAFLNFNSGIRTISGVPKAQDRGNYTITIVGTDPYGASVNVNIMLQVINSAPQPEGRIFDQQVSKLDSHFTFTVPSFTDNEGDVVSFSAEMLDGKPLPSWLSFDPLTRIFSGSPGDAPAGNYLINVVAVDSLGLSQKVGFNLAIQTPPNIDLGTSKTELVKNTAPFAGAGGLIVLIAGLLIWRQRRIKTTELRIQTWARSRQLKMTIASEVIEFEALSAQLHKIGKQLTRGIALSSIESNLLAFEKQLRQYYAQRIRHEPMTTLLGLQIVEKFIQFVARNILEIHRDEYDSEKTLGAARLLHCFMGLILSEHTGRRHQLSQKTKAQYAKDLEELIARTRRASQADIAILHELESAREALICASDTNTLRLLCQASATHILSPGALVADLKQLAFDIPSNWYVLLLELNNQAASAKTDLSVLSQIQARAAKQTDWRFLYGMISLLLDIIIHTQNPVIKSQAIMGQASYCRIQLLGLLQLLQINKGYLCRPSNTRVQRQAKWALNQARLNLSFTERKVLNPYLNTVATFQSRRISVIATPLDISASSSTNNSRLSASLQSVNPLHSTALVTRRQSMLPARVPMAHRPSGIAMISSPQMLRVRPQVKESYRASIFISKSAKAAEAKMDESLSVGASIS